jgi:CRISPR-associated protein Cmr1
MAAALEQLIVERLRTQPEVRRVYLFGSRARGDNAPRADIDIAVDCAAADSGRWHEIEELVEETDTLLRIDLVRLDEAPPDLRARILSEGRLLYERR